MSAFHSCKLTISPELVYMYTNMLLSQVQDEEDDDSPSLSDLLSNLSTSHGIKQQPQTSAKKEAPSIAPFYRPEGLTMEDFTKAFEIEQGRASAADFEAASLQFYGKEMVHPLTGETVKFSEKTFPPLFASAIASMTGHRGYWMGGVPWRPEVQLKKVCMAIPPSVVSDLWKMPGFRDYIFVGVVETAVEGQEKPKSQIAVSCHNFSQNPELKDLVESRIRDMFIEQWQKAADRKIAQVKNNLAALQEKLESANIRVTTDKVRVTSIKNIKLMDGISDPRLLAKGLTNCSKGITLSFDYEYVVKPSAKNVNISNPDIDDSIVKTPSKTPSKTTAPKTGPTITRT